MAPPPRRHPRDLVEHIAATIRRVDGNHTTGTAALAEAIVDVDDLSTLGVRRAKSLSVGTT